LGSGSRGLSEGFDVKVLKEILRRRKQDKDERDEMVFEGRLFSPRFNQPSMITAIGLA